MNYLLKYLVSLVNLIKCFLLTVYLMVYLCGYHLTVHLKVYLMFYIMVHLWGYLLWYGIYISKTYFKKFSYNKDIKMDIL